MEPGAVLEGARLREVDLSETDLSGIGLANTDLGVAVLRAAYFIHELTHRSDRELPGFRLAWLWLVGIPIGVPSLMMWPHREHHRCLLSESATQGSQFCLSRGKIL